MVKKLLPFLLFPVLLLLNSWSGFGQGCPDSVSISASPGNTVCSGTPVTFTANTSGGSGTLSYEWKIDGTNAGANSNTFSTSDLDNGDKITVTVTSSDDASCSGVSIPYTMTVNANRTPTVSLSANKTSICPGEQVIFTASSTNGGSNPQYSFYLNNGSTALQAGSSNIFSTTSLSNGDKIRVELTSDLTCVTSETAEATSNSVNVRAGIPVVPSEISGTIVVCPGTSQTYSIAAVSGATSYQWTLPSGWSGSSSSTSINTTSGTSGGTITVKAINDCGTGEAQVLNITVKAGTPAVPGTITGASAVCPGTSQTYSIAAVNNADSYIWTLPSGWTGTSETNSITVQSGAAGGNISVQSKNDCGTSAAKTLAVSVKSGTPAIPETISGTPEVCPGTQQTYSITNVPGATSYIWTLPNGWTGSSATRTITVTTGTTGGNITVKASNDCGTSAEQTLGVTVKAGTPSTPVSISGSSLVCPGTQETYSVSPVAGATEYIWTLPNGWTGSSSLETITVTTAQSGSGTISVKAKNDCGTSPASSFSVSVNKPAPVMNGNITGSAEVCSTATGLTYSIPAITNATEYIWSVPTGWNITSGTDTNSITVSASSSSGNISVIAKNTCGESAASSNFAVNSTVDKPSTPGVISSNLPSTAVCPPLNGIKFWIDEVANATGYQWILPEGWEIISGANSIEITVNITANAKYTGSQSISVEAKNVCGNSPKSTLSGIAIDDFVVTDLGEDMTVCRSTNTLNLSGYIAFGSNNSKLKISSLSTTGTNSIQGNLNGNFNSFPFSYTPSTTDLNAGQITFTLITEKPGGACNSGKDEMTVFFKELPTATITATSPVCNGSTSTLTFTGTPNSRITYKLPNNSNKTVDLGSTGTATVTTAALTTNSTYSLVSAVNLDTPACTFTFPTSASTTITVTPKPSATLTYAGAPFCKSLTSNQNPTLEGTNAYKGGTYSSTDGLTIDSATGGITPSTSTPGTYTVTYSIPQGGGCSPVTATTQVTITKAPTATISYTGIPFCTSDTAAKSVTLTGTDNFSGGTYSATPAGLNINSGTGAITPASSTAGTYTVTYETPATGGCGPFPFTTEVTITKAPTVTISYPDAPFCLSDSTEKVVTLSGTDNYSGGTFSAPAGLSINASTGTITPASSTPGTYEVTYETLASDGCGKVITKTNITVTQTPAAEISYASPFCNNDETPKTVTFSNTAGIYEGGTFSATPAGLKIDPVSGAIDAKNSSPDTYTVLYSLPSGNGCASSDVSTTVTITQSPSVDISYTTPLCSSDATLYPVTFSNGTGAFDRGTFSGTDGLSIDANGNIDPSNSTAGVHTITYTTPEGDGCESNDSTTNVEIFNKVVITTEPENIGICSTQPASFEVVASGDNLTYEWKRTDGKAITNATGVNSSKLSFSNATSTNAGEYYVEVTGSSPCTMAVSEPVTLNIDENIVIIKPTEPLSFCDQTREDVTFEFIAHAKGAPLTFTWIKDGAEIPGTNTERFTFNSSGPVGENGEYTGTFKIQNPNPSDNGVYAVRINGPEYFTCSEAVSKTFTLNINPLPDPPVTVDLTYCQNAESLPLTASGENGATFTWYDSEMNAIEGIPTPSTSEAGTTTYYVSQTTEVCESNKSPISITVKPTPAAPTTNQSISFCYGDTVTDPLTASMVGSNSTLNWYGPDDPNLTLDSAPIPTTTTTGTFKYWVSETFEGCESPVVEIVVQINPLPEISVSADQAIICQGSSAVLTASGGTSYEWFIGETSIGTGAELSVSPTTETVYTVVGTNENSCQNSTSITIGVDQPTLAGTITGAATVCFGSNAGSLLLSDYNGQIQIWESSVDNGLTWEELKGTEGLAEYSYVNLVETTQYRVMVGNGVCEPISSDPFTITVDPVSIGGVVQIEGTTDTTILVCHQADATSVTPLVLSGEFGNVVRWEYSSDSGRNWITVDNTTNSLSYAGISETRIYRAVVQSGTCSVAFSEVAIVSVIPNIKPSPVTQSETEVCLGDDVLLTAKSGFATSRELAEGGSFDHANPEGWLSDGSSTDLSSGNSNTNGNRWALSATNGGTYSSVGYKSDGKFAIAHGNFETYMETPVFNTVGLTTGTLEFDQAYRFLSGSYGKVEISIDGGTSWILLEDFNGPADTGSSSYTNFQPMEIDLSSYLGRTNLKIRFHFKGNTGSSWAIDNIRIPDAPVNEEIEWTDEEGNYLGNQETLTVTPAVPGENIFAVTSIINGCRSRGDAGTVYVKVFAYDSNEANAGEDQILSCGTFEANLTATYFSNFTGENILAEGSTAQWTVTSGQESSTYSFSDPTDPEATFSAAPGDYTLTWTVSNPGPCEDSFDTITVSFSECKNLNFDGIDDYIVIEDDYDEVLSIEAWIRPKSTGGTIISGPNFKITTPPGVNPNSRWYHIAVSGGKLYIDGIENSELSLGSGGEKTLIGAEWVDGKATKFFSGWIEEVRLWNKELTVEQIQFMMNQRLIPNGAQMGEQIPMDVPGGLTYSDLAGYYRLISADPDPLGLVTFDPTLMPSNGETPSLANTSIPGRLMNMKTDQQNTAPLPYFSANDGIWETDATWARPKVWDPPHTGPIEWNIVKTSNYIESGEKDIKVLGLIIESSELDILNPAGNHDETNSGQSIEVSHYLKLNGVLDLTGESQLIQPMGGIVDNNSTGYLERDQQGTQSSFNYNYWSAPVSKTGAGNNSGFVLKDGLLDGTNSAAPEPIDFGGEYHWADGNYTGNLRISSFWLNTYTDFISNTYSKWNHFTETGLVNTGVGYTMKGTSGTAAITDRQNYVFRGKPNNGTIELSITKGNDYLVGNPYPSAIDSKEFILDNLKDSGGNNSVNVFNGTLYFWDHFGGHTHYLQQYIGGYAALTLTGGVRAISNDIRINANLDESSTVPQKFIPVGQAFYVSTQTVNGVTASGGTIIFQNSQREFITEQSGDGSIFMSQKNNKSPKEAETDNREKIWLKFHSPTGYHRQILVGVDPNASNDFDIGYDAPLIENNVEDMFWIFNDAKFVIQGVENLNEDQELPLGIKVAENKKFSIEIDELKNIPDEMNIFLKDSILNVFHDLRDGPYESSAEPGTIKDRFKIVFKKPEPEKPQEPVEPEIITGDFNIKYVSDSREIMIRNPQLHKIGRVYLNNLLGQQIHVYYNIPTQVETNLPVSRFPAGVYIVKLHSDQGIISKKIILE